MPAALANQLTSPGRLIKLRGREWVVLPSDDTELLLLKPLGGSEEEITGVFLPLGFSEDEPHEAEFPQPQAGRPALRAVGRAVAELEVRRSGQAGTRRFLGAD